MAEEVPRTTNNQALRRMSSDQEDWDSMKRNKRGKSSFLKPQDSSLSICKNPACEATQSTVPGFCKRCCCCICCQFNNMDPSLCLKCTPESGPEGSCGSSCHVECALRHGMVRNGSYTCATCGKVSSIIGFWKKQLKIAMDSKHVDILCYRIFLNYRLLKGTSRFCELRKFIEDMKTALEKEFGPLSEAAVKFSRARTGRLNSSVQALCMLAIQKAEELQTSNSTSLLNLSAEGSVSNSVHQYKNRADAKSDSREKLVQKRGKEPQSGEKCMGVGGVDAKTLQVRLQLPDLNEEFQESGTKTSIAAVEKREGLDEDFENIVRIIRGLEQGGHVSMEFRLKFLTWFSLKARENERRVVRTFMTTMLDDPSGLAGQLVDTFSAIIFCN
ncbi:VIN3-like protein 1 isoform X1 [Salvia splendens]|uniref:VIN3-like protein 1 isoform X1 n=1 Tax=Salvia splendens TaxID=180675 RepID=UPI001C27446F|nr:VIN3-like protein 1 isoform X1 [Salvia splendens]XP_042001105.1 VIN3-like protein 1 isoform X1 [Salvia splendens]XP_042001112.1 VIN3-like protein 1 isoform X1 [Salvia splendens]XP_042001119.1 VIN3-like protein 1 isoform X1 [Salvia splendens]XP_042001125.1 VIN3-like protein 1 isoform X1 [Salvia splendens]XP_042001132.1 VIN3-like protein 1 isoform X1 [Salvia splendens]